MSNFTNSYTNRALRDDLISRPFNCDLVNRADLPKNDRDDTAHWSVAIDSSRTKDGDYFDVILRIPGSQRPLRMSAKDVLSLRQYDAATLQKRILNGTGLNVHLDACKSFLSSHPSEDTQFIARMNRAANESNNARCKSRKW